MADPSGLSTTTSRTSRLWYSSAMNAVSLGFETMRPWTRLSWPVLRPAVRLTVAGFPLLAGSGLLPEGRGRTPKTRSRGCEAPTPASFCPFWRVTNRAYSPARKQMSSLGPGWSGFPSPFFAAKSAMLMGSLSTPVPVPVGVTNQIRVGKTKNFTVRSRPPFLSVRLQGRKSVPEKPAFGVYSSWPIWRPDFVTVAEPPLAVIGAQTINAVAGSKEMPSAALHGILADLIPTLPMMFCGYVGLPTRIVAVGVAVGVGLLPPLAGWVFVGTGIPPVGVGVGVGVCSGSQTTRYVAMSAAHWFAVERSPSASYIPRSKTSRYSEARGRPARSGLVRV